MGGITTAYAGNYIYEDGDLQCFSHPEGYVSPDGSGEFDYVYQYKDHLGNIRLSYSDSDGDGTITASTEIIEENNYYPFGLKHKGYNNTIVSEHPYKYNGKELNEELGLDWYDYGARNYEASLGKWMNVDPLADKYYDLSTYNYTANNPILFTDPNGAHIDISGLNDVQKKAFGKFLNTNQGKRFLKLYGSANQVVLGHEVGPTGGKFSYHSVYFYSHDNQSFTKGKGGKTRTRFLSRKSKDYIGFHQVSETNITRNLLFQVQIGTKENEIESTVTIGHEVLVHVENITNSFENIVNDYNDGALSKEAKKRRISKNQLLKEKISGIIGAKKDHKLFVNGENVNYEEFIKELGSLFKRKSDSDKKNTKEYEKL